MKKINFLFAIHCHQPVGNFEDVIEDAYNKSYVPFIAALEKFPSVRMTVHYTGILLSWFKDKHPEFLQRLAALVEAGQIEIMSGAYYEPILTVIPDRDKIGQIFKQSDFTKKHLKYEPRGLWLAERIWEPHLPKILSEAGIDYTALDDYHFVSAGLEEKDLNGYYVTEEAGVTLNVFPINKKLRYLMPFREAKETIDYLRELATEAGDRAAIIADDGEKFGVWPGTFKWVFEEKWLEKFFGLLQQESSWIQTKTFSEYLDEYPPKGRVYLPTASYFEMMEWSLMTNAGKKFEGIVNDLKHTGRFDNYQQFFKGGFWRNFFVKYPESNNMHKKMLYVSKKVAAIEKNTDENIDDIFDDLWQGQCNCPYWHGVFGGLYLNYLRHAIYEHLINAEKAADSIIHKFDKWVHLDTEDFDKDGYDEILVSTNTLNAYFCPSYGGALFELDFKPKSFNLLNTLSRKEEAYHSKILQTNTHQLTLTGTANGTASIHDSVRVKEVGLQKYLNYDWYRRLCFLDHFLGEATTLENFADCKYEETGDFVNLQYEHSHSFGKTEVLANLEREGFVKVKGERYPVKVKKVFRISSENSDIEAKWEVTNLSSKSLNLWMGIEFNFSLLAGNAPDRYYLIEGDKPKEPHLASRGETKGIYSISLVDKWSGISIIIEAGKRVDFWRFPIETVSQSEGGFERTYQNSVVLPNFKFSLPAKGTEQFCITLKIQEGGN